MDKVEGMIENPKKRCWFHKWDVYKEIIFEKSYHSGYSLYKIVETVKICRKCDEKKIKQEIINR